MLKALFIRIKFVCQKGADIYQAAREVNSGGFFSGLIEPAYFYFILINNFYIFVQSKFE